MKFHQMVRGFLTGAAALALVAPLACNQDPQASASAPKQLRITTNRDRLLFSKPGSRKVLYSHKNKGLLVKELGRVHYHHRLYYRVATNQFGRKHHIAYVLASQVNNVKHPVYKLRRQAKRTRANQHRTRKTNRKARRVAKRHSKRQAPKANKMSTTKWYVNANGNQPVKDLKEFNGQVRKESVRDIQIDRRNNGKHGLKESRQLNALANYRAKQADKRFSHYMTSQATLSDSYFEHDAHKFGINPNTISWGENIARNNYSGNPSQTADQLNDGYMNDDANSQWSHRSNILNSRWSKVGVGSYHDNNTHTTYQAEIFAGK